MNRDLRSVEPAPIVVARNWPTEFRVPVEMVLKCTTSVFRGVIEKRRANNDFAHPEATVFVRDGRFYATVTFGPGRVDIFMPLDCWAWENKPDGERAQIEARP